MQRDCTQVQGAGKGYTGQGGQQGYPGKGYAAGIRALHSLETILKPDIDHDEKPEVIEWIIPDTAPDIVDSSNLNSEKIGMDKKIPDIEPPPHLNPEWNRVKSKAERKREKKRLIGCSDTGCYDTCCNLGLLETVGPTEEVNAMGEWEELIMAVDSGATETVVNGDNAKNVPTVTGPASKAGVKYALANGETVENEGEKHMFMSSSEGVNRLVTAQVTEVSKPLLSVSKMVNAGNTVVFSKDNSYIYDGTTGEVMNLEERNGMYLLKVWIKSSSGFQGFGGNP